MRSGSPLGTASLRISRRRREVASTRHTLIVITARPSSAVRFDADGRNRARVFATNLQMLALDLFQMLHGDFLPLTIDSEHGTLVQVRVSNSALEGHRDATVHRH